jgi:RNA polymerase sigma-70 factor (ECF subfamily)
MKHITASDDSGTRDALYASAYRDFAPALTRLARATEADVERSRDLEQDIHLALWRSLAAFDGRCALGTWVWRVAHNTAATHVAQAMRRRPGISLDHIEDLAGFDDPEASAGRTHLLHRIHSLAERLKPADRTVILLYLEGLDAAAIGDVVGLSAPHVAVKVHRARELLAKHFRTGDPL